MSLWLWMVVAHAQCDDPGPLLDTLEGYVLAGQLDEASETSARIVSAFGCGAFAEPRAVARLWLAEAVLASARGEHTAAQDALAAAARLSPETWNDLYGPVLEQRWRAASQEQSEPGRVEIGLLPPGYVGVIDGAEMSFPALLPPGPHLLQVGLDHAVAAMRFELPSGFDLVLAPEIPSDLVPRLSVLPDLQPATAPQSPSTRDRRVSHALVAGGAAVLLYGATFATHAAYESAPPGQPPEGLRSVSNGLVLVSAGLGLTSGGMLVRGLATPALHTSSPER